MTQKESRRHIEIEDLLTEVAEWQKENPKSTLLEIENMIDGKLAVVRKKLVETAFQEEDAPTFCRECDTLMVKNGKKKRQLQIKGGGVVKFDRTQKRCLNCGETVFPPR